MAPPKAKASQLCMSKQLALLDLLEEFAPEGVVEVTCSKHVAGEMGFEAQAEKPFKGASTHNEASRDCSRLSLCAASEAHVAELEDSAKEDSDPDEPLKLVPPICPVIADDDDWAVAPVITCDDDYWVVGCGAEEEEWDVVPTPPRRRAPTLHVRAKAHMLHFTALTEVTIPVTDKISREPYGVNDRAPAMPAMFNTPPPAKIPLPSAWLLARAAQAMVRLQGLGEGRCDETCYAGCLTVRGEPAGEPAGDQLEK